MAKFTVDIEIDITPSAAFNIPWKSIEINPVRHDEDRVTYIKCDDEKDAEFWSIYLRGADGEARCIADMPTKTLATQLAKLIKYASKSRVKK